MRRAAPMTGQLAFDDCTPDWTAAEPQPHRQKASTRYRLRMNNDLWGQRLPAGRCRIITIPITEEYL